MKYPPYACKHCGLANADMFYDWYIHTHNTEPTKEDWDAFQAYRQLYEAHKEQEKWQNNITGGKPISSVEWLRRYRKLKKEVKNGIRKSNRTRQRTPQAVSWHQSSRCLVSES